ncbi:HlyD family secretion protein [Pedobacter sp. UBA5917]|jgi:multidrug efflux pump subunit AcrA (membrane-fusion protein)|uniref:HlyD family secretion protein n=1 Tax=Pedobacter sp. UBA5917 TaxID=1947061 RepID=UPI0025FF7C7C|nr:efflux RND transporter periplasmic adaptor subunit [Pedobacter sp. UBA5917]
MNTSRTLIFFILTIIAAACTSKKTDRAEQAALRDSLSRAENTVVALAEVQPEKKIISLFAQGSGPVKKVFFDIGDTVKKGELIALLNSSVEEAQLQQAQSKIMTQQAAIQTAKAQQASLDSKSQNSALNYERNSALLKSGGVTRQATDDSKFAARSDLKDAQAAAATAKQSEYRLSEFKSDVKYAQSILDQKKVRAPYDGTILSLDLKVGKYVNANESFGEFAPAGRLMAIAEVDELYAQKIKLGMKAYLRSQGKQDTLASGAVFIVSPYLNKKSLFSDGAANMEDRRVREVRILLDKGSSVIIGSRVDCVIKLK